MTFDLSGSGLDDKTKQCCFRLVQSYVLCPGYRHQPCFTIPNVERLRKMIDEAGVLSVSTGFDLWKEFCHHDLDSFVNEQKKAYRKLLLQLRKDCESYFIGRKKANCEARSRQSSSSTVVGSVSSSVVKYKKMSAKTVSLQSATKNVSKAGTSKKSASKGGACCKEGYRG